jgi:hypothetical protein
MENPFLTVKLVFLDKCSLRQFDEYNIEDELTWEKSPGLDSITD